MSNSTRKAVQAFIEKTAELPEYERSQVWAEALHYARIGQISQIPKPLADWFRQLVNYLDDGGPRPDYWPTRIPWIQQ